jgi:hypothetical protein
VETDSVDDRESARRGRWDFLLLACAVALAALAAHVETLDNFFLGDDYTMVAANYGKTFRQELALLASDEIGGLWHERFVRPVRSWSLRADYAVSGLRPLTYHLSDITAHAATSIAISFLVLSLGGEVLPALFAALLFLLHPMNVDVVAWNTARDESLSASTLLFSLLLHVRSGFSLRPNVPAVGSWMLFAASLFTKEYAVLFPLALVGFVLVSRKSLREAWPRFLPFVAIVAIFIGIRWVVFGNPVGGYGSGHTYLRGDLFLSSLLSFLRALAAPAIDHPLPFAIALAGALALAVGPAKRGAPPWKWIVYWGVVWVGLFLLPTHNLVFTPRHLYLSFAGVAVAIGLALSHGRWRYRTGAAAAGLAGLVLTLLPPTVRSERAYATKALECEAAIEKVRTEAERTEDGAVLVLVGFPQHREPPWGFGWSLSEALGPPFLPETLDARVRIVVRRGWRESAWLNYREQFPGAPIRVLRWRPDRMGAEVLVPPEEDPRGRARS